MIKAKILSFFLVSLFSCTYSFAQENFELPMPPEPTRASIPAEIIQKPKRSASQKQTESKNATITKHPETEDPRGPEPPVEHDGFRHPKPKKRVVTQHAEKRIPEPVESEPVVPPALPMPPKAEVVSPN